MKPDTVKFRFHFSGKAESSHLLPGLLCGEFCHTALLNIAGKLRYLFMARHQATFTPGKRALSLSHRRQYFKPPPFALFPHGQGFLYCVFFTVQSAGFNSLADKRFLI